MCQVAGLTRAVLRVQPNVSTATVSASEGHLSHHLSSCCARSGDWDNNNQNDLFAVDLDGNLRQVTTGKTTLGFG